MLVVSPGEGRTQRHMQSHWARPLADLLAGREAPITLFANDRERLSQELPHAGDLLYVGHGTADALGIPALLDVVNVSAIGGRIVAIACRSAQRLGPEAVAAGTHGYVGFVDDVHVIEEDVLDNLIVRNFEPLLKGACSSADFEARFTADCEDVQRAYFTGGRRRDRNAWNIATAAQVMKLSIRIL